MLDSSPVALPPLPRPLKRSASTASLPTPPRTHHKRKTKKQNVRSAASSESDSEIATASEEEDGGNEHRHKKRRTSESKEDEEAFWMGASSSKTLSTGTSAKTTTLRSPSASVSPAPVLYRKRQNNTTGVAPVSPPPSRRKTTATTKSASAAASTPATVASTASTPPVTPKSKYPLRDSPDNPFLETPVGDDDTSASLNASPVPRTPPREKPTITYVFRGVRAKFANPHYDHNRNRPLSPTPTSLLPVDHPEFSPDAGCPPKLLFPGARRKRGGNNTLKRNHAQDRLGSPEPGASTRRSRRLGSPGTVEEDEVEEAIKPMKLTFGDRSPRTREGTAGSGGVKTKERDDPIRRAMGPTRR